MQHLSVWQIYHLLWCCLECVPPWERGDCTLGVILGVIHCRALGQWAERRMRAGHGVAIGPYVRSALCKRAASQLRNYRRPACTEMQSLCMF